MTVPDPTDTPREGVPIAFRVRYNDHGMPPNFTDWYPSRAELLRAPVPGLIPGMTVAHLLDWQWDELAWETRFDDEFNVLPAEASDA